MNMSVATKNVKKIARTITFTDVDLQGTVDDKTITEIIRDHYGYGRPKIFTKVVLKWEEA